MLLAAAIAERATAATPPEARRVKEPLVKPLLDLPLLELFFLQCLWYEH